MSESGDLWFTGGVILAAGALGFLKYKNAMDKKELIGKLAAAAQTPAKEAGIPLALIVTQAAHESNYGKSGLALKSNNLFGIKGGASWPGRVDQWPTWEFINGKNVQVMANFRKYDSWEESVRDWIKFISRPRYEKALAAAKAGNSKLFFEELQKAGYATDPNYSVKLNSTLNTIGALV